MSKLTKSVLAKAAQLVDTNWGQGYYCAVKVDQYGNASRSDREPVTLADAKDAFEAAPEKVCFCLVGAVAMAYALEKETVYVGDVEDILQEEIVTPLRIRGASIHGHDDSTLEYTSDLIRFNDDPRTSKEDVKRVLSQLAEAIEA